AARTTIGASRAAAPRPRFSGVLRVYPWIFCIFWLLFTYPEDVQMKLRTRILWLCAATLLGLVVLSAVALTTLYQSMMKERTAQLSTLVMLAHAAAQKAHDKEKSGALSREDAIEEARRTIGSFVDKDKYFFVR